MFLVRLFGAFLLTLQSFVLVPASLEEKQSVSCVSPGNDETRVLMQTSTPSIRNKSIDGLHPGAKMTRLFEQYIIIMKHLNFTRNGTKVDPDLQREFEGIFQKNEWGSPESHSGSGSELDTTKQIRECLGAWIKNYAIKDLLDIPCGDANWQAAIPGIENVSYFGYDISPGAVALANTKNLMHSNMKFGVLDLVSSDPPETADMIIVKEVIQHLPLEMGLKMLQHAKSADIKWLAVTTNPKCQNVNIKPGDWFPGPNAEAPPFNFGQPAEVCGENDLRLYDLNSWSGDR